MAIYINIHIKCIFYYKNRKRRLLDHFTQRPTFKTEMEDFQEMVAKVDASGNIALTSRCYSPSWYGRCLRPTMLARRIFGRCSVSLVGAARVRNHGDGTY